MTTPRVSVAVMAHPTREKFVPELVAALDRPATVVWDSGNNDRWDTGRRSMLAYDPDATHHLVVQDDAIVCRDLTAGLEQALQHVPPDSPVCLYLGRVTPYKKMISGLVAAAGTAASWVSMGQIHWGVGIVMPTSHIPPMVEWCDQRSSITNYDRRMSRWCQHEGLTVHYTWPSLVDHRDSPSLVPGRTGRRHAHRFLGADASALDVRWDGPVVSIPELTPGLPPGQLASGAWKVTAPAVRASVASDSGGRASQLWFKGTVLTGLPVVEVQHLMSMGLIVPVMEEQHG